MDTSGIILFRIIHVVISQLVMKEMVMRTLEVNVHVREVHHWKCVCRIMVSSLFLSEPSSSPNSVTVSALPSRKMSVSWSRPSQSGGRSDLYYTVQHSDPDRLGQFIGTTCLSSSATSHTYTDLRPGTQYCVRVMAHNGVSDQDSNRCCLRTIQKCETTRLERKLIIFFTYASMESKL